MAHAPDACTPVGRMQGSPCADEDKHLYNLYKVFTPESVQIASIEFATFGFREFSPASVSPSMVGDDGHTSGRAERLSAVSNLHTPEEQ